MSVCMCVCVCECVYNRVREREKEEANPDHDRNGTVIVIKDHKGTFILDKLFYNSCITQVKNIVQT